MDDWKKFNETSLPGRDITDLDYTHAKRDCKDFKIKTYENTMIYMFKAIHYC